ncbi:MAG TPA: EVE domain-containing protein [Thermoanaerobaculia bacterium]|nr:EVE domain-containing protein [Thermoanaerobaculia bacterium]
MRYWINTVSRDHVERGKQGQFTQANHGRPTGLRQAGHGDFIAFYSPRTEFEGGDTLQSFTAVAVVADEKAYQERVTPDFHPWRRRVEYLPATDVPIRPLIDELEFIRDKKSWGFMFRRGFFEINEADFRKIARAMGVETPS